jgi:probable phosphoglycerate mutase
MQGDKPAGVLQLNLRRDADKGVGSIPFCYLLPDFRRKGLGVQLLGQAVSVYRGLGRSYLRLRCAPDNLVAQRFYQRHGFHKIGEDPGSRVPLDILEKYIGYDE